MKTDSFRDEMPLLPLYGTFLLHVWELSKTSEHIVFNLNTFNETRLSIKEKCV